MTAIPEELRQLAKFARKLKGYAVDTLPRGDMPPAVLAERQGKVFAGAVAGQVDKTLAFRAAHVLASSSAPDVLGMASDAFSITRPKKPGQSYEEAKDEQSRMWPAGSMQKAWEAGQREGIVQTLFVAVVKRNGEELMLSMPYEYTPPRRASFKWLEPSCGYDQLGGLVFEQLRQAMASPLVLDRAEIVAAVQSQGNESLRDRTAQLYHATRAGLRILAEHGCLTFDWQDEPQQDDKMNG